MSQCRHALRPDGLFLASLLGGDTLQELRIACSVAMLEREGGLSPVVSPLAQVRGCPSLYIGPCPSWTASATTSALSLSSLMALAPLTDPSSALTSPPSLPLPLPSTHPPHCPCLYPHLTPLTAPATALPLALPLPLPSTPCPLPLPSSSLLPLPLPSPSALPLTCPPLPPPLASCCQVRDVGHLLTQAGLTPCRSVMSATC